VAPGAAVIGGVPHGVAPGAIQEAPAHRSFRVLLHDISGRFAVVHQLQGTMYFRLLVALHTDSVCKLPTLLAALRESRCCPSWAALHGGLRLSCRFIS